MAYGNEILKRLESLQLANELSIAAKTHEKDFEELNKLQLTKGQDRTGSYLPKYVDDPYFTTIEKALNYQRWKASISSPDKPVGVMDFYINGKYHRNIVAEVNGLNLTTLNNAEFASSIDEKTGNKALGINPESAGIAWQLFIKPYLMKSISEKTGIK